MTDISEIGLESTPAVYSRITVT